MPTFDPKTTNWTTFIQDFEDFVVEMGRHGHEISKLKLCFSETVKEFIRALFISSATFQTDGDHSVVETRDHSGNLNGDLNCEDFIEVISEDVFTADITTAASQYQVSAGVPTKPGVDYCVANSDGTGDDGLGLLLQSASEISTTQGKVSAAVTGEGNVNLSCSKVSVVKCHHY